MTEPSTTETWGPAVHVFDLRDERLFESSGVSSSSVPGVIFTHNDSGDTARFFAVGALGQTLGTFNVTGGLAVDWEDMDWGPGSFTETALYFGDIGDNFLIRPFLTVYEVAEPSVDAGSPRGEAGVDIIGTKTLLYEDGPHDAEAMFIDPKTRSLGIITKDADGKSGVYTTAPIIGSGLGVLTKVADIDVSAIARPQQDADFSASSRLQTTGADITPQGDRLLVRTYVEAFEWHIEPSIAEGVSTTPTRIPLPRTTQAEAIAYVDDGQSIITTTEQRPSPVHRLTLESATSAASSC